MLVAVRRGGASSRLRVFGVLGLLRWIAAFFRPKRLSPRAGGPTTAAIPPALGTDAGEPSPHPVQPVQDADPVSPEGSPEPDLAPGEENDRGVPPVSADPDPAPSDHAAGTAEAKRNLYASLPDGPLSAAGAVRPVHESAGVEEPVRVAADESAAAAAVEVGGAADAEDGRQPGLRRIAAAIDHASMSTYRVQPVLPPRAPSGLRAAEEGPAQLPASEALAGEKAAGVAADEAASVPGPPPVPASPGQPAVPAETSVGEAPEAAPGAGTVDGPSTGSGAPEAADALGQLAAFGTHAGLLVPNSAGLADRTGDIADDGGIVGAGPGTASAEVAAGGPIALEDPGRGVVVEPDPGPSPSPGPPTSEEPDRMVPEADEGCDAEAPLDPASELQEDVSASAGLAEDGVARHGQAADDGADAAALPDAPTVPLARRPGQYRPRLSRTRVRRGPAADPSAGGDMQNLGADLQLLIGVADWGVELSALLRIPAGAVDGVEVQHDGVGIWLGRLDDQLLEPFALTDASAALGEPLLVTAAGLPARWSRSARDLHVFAPDHRVAGYVSRARVSIGQESVVICREGLAGAARTQILATGSPEPARIDGPNVPEGWVCWRGVRPVRPSLPVDGPSILDALDPLPSVSIELTGGIQLTRGVWLEGHPPSVRLLGLLSEGDPVLIDGRTASIDADGAWAAAGWDAPGAHMVDHGGKSAGYSIEPATGDWGWWPAWEGATRLAGALSDGGGGEFFHVGGPAVLLGARPGQICGFAPSASGIGVARPDFEPVWLLTAGSGTRRGTASSVGPLRPPGRPVVPPAAVERWVRAVCASGRAGTDRSAERSAWNRYVAAARSQRRRRR